MMDEVLFQTGMLEGRGIDHRRVQQYSFLKIDHEIFYAHSLPIADSRRAVINFWQNHVYKHWH